jgi:hypothetical protein
MWQFFQDLIQSLADGIGDAFSWLGGVLSSFFEALKHFFALLLQPLLSLVNGILYLLDQVFTIVVLVVQVVFGLFRLLGSVIVGLFNTFTQLLYFARPDGSGGLDYYHMPSAYSQGYNAVADFLGLTGFGTLALILAVFVWILTAWAVVKIVGGES